MPEVFDRVTLETPAEQKFRDDHEDWVCTYSLEKFLRMSFEPTKVQTIIDENSIQYISTAFTWRHTEQGRDFWFDFSQRSHQERGFQILRAMLARYREVSALAEGEEVTCTYSASNFSRMIFKIDHARSFIDGNIHALNHAFLWTATNEGDRFWRSVYMDPQSNLRERARTIVRAMIARYEAMPAPAPAPEEEYIAEAMPAPAPAPEEEYIARIRFNAGVALKSLTNVSRLTSAFSWNETTQGAEFWDYITRTGHNDESKAEILRLVAISIKTEMRKTS